MLGSHNKITRPEIKIAHARHVASKQKRKNVQPQQFAAYTITHARTQKMRARARKLQLADIAGVGA